MKKQFGEIGTLLTIIAVVLMTAGVFLGSALVSKFSAPSSRTQAQATSPIVPNAANQDIEARFGTISNRGGTDQKMIETFICFKGTGNPPSIGRYKIEAQIVLKNGDAPINIGGSLEEPISNPLDRYHCNSEIRHVLYTYNSIEDIPGDITYDQVEKIEFIFTSITGNWDPLPAEVIGTMTDMTEIFGPRPSPPASEIIVCPGLDRVTTAPILDRAKQNYTTIPGWNQLEGAGPESATNRRKKSLALQDMTKDYHETTNSFVFLAQCPSIPTTYRAGKLTFNVKMNNTAFTGDFDGFEYVLHSCSFNDKNSDGRLNDGEAENCDVAPNFKGQIVTIKKEGPAAINKVDTKTFDLPAGKRVVYMDYGFWKKYGTPQARKDVSGVEVTYSSTCTSLLEKAHETGPAMCLVTIDGDTSIEAAVKLPDATKAVYRLSYSTKVADATSDYKGAEIANCSVGSNAQNTTVAGPCTKDNQVPIPALIYSNTTQTATKVAYVITRCTGESATICKPNKFFTDTIDVKNIFSEAALFELTPGNRRICKFDPSKFPTTDITDAKVRDAVTCNIMPVPTSTTPPTEIAEYYANLSLYNSSTKNIVHAKTRACANGITCTDDEQDLEIAPGTRELVSIKIGNIKPETNFYTLRVYVRLDGSETERGLTEEFNVQDPQSVYYDLKVSDTAVDGSAETELDASDVSGNKCVNADDAAKVIAKLAEFTSPDQCIPEDINCDGVVNILDLAVIIPNLNGGTGCAANQPLIAPSQSIIAP